MQTERGVDHGENNFSLISCSESRETESEIIFANKTSITVNPLSLHYVTEVRNPENSIAEKKSYHRQTSKEKQREYKKRWQAKQNPEELKEKNREYCRKYKLKQKELENVNIPSSNLSTNDSFSDESTKEAKDHCTTSNSSTSTVTSLRERMRASCRKWREKNQQRCREYFKNYRLKQKELLKLQDSRKQIDEDEKEKQRQTRSQWREKNREKCRQYVRNYRMKSKSLQQQSGDVSTELREKNKEWQKSWKERNRERCREYVRNYRRKRQLGQITLDVTPDITIDGWQLILPSETASDQNLNLNSHSDVKAECYNNSSERFHEKQSTESYVNVNFQMDSINFSDEGIKTEPS